MRKTVCVCILKSLSLLFLTPLLADKPHPWQIGLQESASPVMDAISSLHNTLLIIISVVAALVAFLLVFVVIRFRAKRNPEPSPVAHNTTLEIIWTLVPVVILGIIAVPSFKLLHFMDKTQTAELTLKVVGHQWFWEYDYPEHQINFNSYLLASDQKGFNGLRLLDVDQAVVLPIETDIKILVTSTDVLHSWATPAFGIKLDAIPGRLRETWVRIHKEGTYYGQCSELCGQGHGFMPIKVIAVGKDQFKKWLITKKHESQSPSTERQTKERG